MDGSLQSNTKEGKSERKGNIIFELVTTEAVAVAFVRFLTNRPTMESVEEKSCKRDTAASMCV